MHIAKHLTFGLICPNNIVPKVFVVLSDDTLQTLVMLSCLFKIEEADMADYVCLYT